MIDAAIIAFAIKYDDLNNLMQAGVSDDDFVDEYRTIWRYLRRMQREHDSLPSRDSLVRRFPDLELPRVRRSELGMLLDTLRKRSKFIKLMHLLNDVAGSGIDYENVDEKIQVLQGNLNTLAFTKNESKHLADLLGDPDVRRLIVRDQKARRSGRIQGIKTGLHRFDRENLGLQKQKMYVIIGRTGIGKSWLDLLFVAHAVMSGQKVILYPLEMTLTETAYRLFTIFSQEMFGGSKTLKNLDLTRGNIPIKKVVRMLHLLEDRFAGQLLVADMGALNDPYTVERIEAEVDMYRPDMFWVDYLTLLKPPPGSKQEDGWAAVQRLSNGIAGIAKRRNAVGGCSAQVNREALKQRVFLPRLEHIAYGDSIGHDADGVFSINRKGEYMYYAMVKNRGGVEIPKMRLKIDFNNGVLREDADQSEDNDEDAA